MKCLLPILIAILLLFSASPDADAQCVMCKAVVEDATEAGVGRGINTAILYLMAVPYLILVALYFGFFRKKRNFVFKG
ncbi:MAG: hypothetical protein ACFCUH_12200 [Flavobacteriales bacterium]